MIVSEEILKIGKDSDNYLFNSDNLDFLNNYVDQLEGKIDLISIDPPYNTGKKMGKYKDSFTSIDNWLDFLSPRLEISKRMLSNGGLIFININEKNSPYLRILCDKIFGIDNHVSTIIWQNKYTVSNDKVGITCQTENILVYSNNIKKVVINSDPLREEYVNSTYKDWDGDKRGPWRKGVQLFKKKNTNEYTVVSPTGKEWTKGWNYSEENWYNVLVKEDILYWGIDGNSCPTKKVFLKDTKGIGIKNLWLGSEVGYTQDGTLDLEKVLNIEASFLYPKPVKLIKRMLKIAARENSIILDFFAGSGTLGQAVLEFNRENNTNMNFILVTNNESNICEDITLKRIGNVIQNDEGFNYIKL
jgi:adenine-specific DNA-methyltransferase